VNTQTLSSTGAFVFSGSQSLQPNDTMQFTASVGTWAVIRKFAIT